jgi:uncharacterized membrane protein YdjX (TVP38/TMEM64 family)
MAGSSFASAVGFWFARFVGRDWVAKAVPARFRRYDDALARRAFATIFTLRFIFWMTPLLHAFFGISKVRASTHFWASAAGYFLPLLVVSYFGQQAFDLTMDLVRAASPATWIGLIAGTIAIAAAIWMIKRRRAARAASPAAFVRECPGK